MISLIRNRPFTRLRIYILAFSILCYVLVHMTDVTTGQTTTSSGGTPIHSTIKSGKTRYYFGINAPKIDSSPRNKYIRRIYESAHDGARWASETKYIKSKVDTSYRSTKVPGVASIGLDSYGEEIEAYFLNNNKSNNLDLMKSMEYVKNEFEHIVGGIDKFLIIFDGLRLKYRSGLGCSPFPERKYFNSNRGVYYFVHPTGDALLNVTGDWLSKRNLKNVSVLSDGSLLSPVDPARAFSVLDEVAVNVNTYLEFNNTSNSKNPDIGYDKFASTLSGRTLFASRLFFVTGRPDFLAYAISEAYKLGRVDDEHLWISTGLPEINVAFELLNTLSNVKQAFRSLYFVQSSMEENFALPGNLDEDTKKELGKNMDRNKNWGVFVFSFSNVTEHDVVYRYVGFAKTMYSAGVSCVFLLHNTNRMDHFSEKNSAGSGGAYPKNEKIQVGSTGLLQELYHKDLSHPVTLYRIKDVVECDTKEDEIGYSNPLLSQHSVRRPYCFEYEPVSTYRMDSTTNSFDITNHMKPIYYDGTETPPSDTKYETRSQTMTSKILISIFVAIVLLASAFIGLLTWKRRNELSVKSASPPLLALVQLGILAALIRSSLYMFKLRIELCKAGLFFEILFYLAVLAPLAIKNWRLYLIFYNPHFSGLSNTRALIICGISILVPLAILVPVLITRDVELATIVTNGTELFAHYRKICPSSTVLISIYAELAVYLYIGMVIAFNIFVSFACRKLSHRYNESTKITLCCYNILIIIILTHLINGLSVQEKDESIPIIFTLGALITLIIVCGTTVLSNYTPLKKLDLGKTAKPSGVNIGGATFFEGGFNEPIRMGDWRPDPSIKDLSPAEEIQTFYCIVKIESRLFSLLDKEYMCQLVWIPSYNLIILMRFDVKSITHNSDKDINSKRSIFHVKECLMIREESMDKKNVVVILPGKRLTLKFETKSEIDKFCDALKIAF